MNAINFKHPDVAGLRIFANEKSAIQAGENPAELVSVGGVLVKWPAALGAPPNDATIAAWQAELDASVAVKVARRAAVKANAEADTLIAVVRDGTDAQITAFVNGEIPGNSKEKQFITKLAIGLAYGLQGGKDK